VLQMKRGVAFNIDGWFGNTFDEYSLMAEYDPKIPFSKSHSTSGVWWQAHMGQEDMELSEQSLTKCSNAKGTSRRYTYC
jgi:hypothetical protein